MYWRQRSVMRETVIRSPRAWSRPSRRCATFSCNTGRVPQMYIVLVGPSRLRTRSSGTRSWRILSNESSWNRRQRAGGAKIKSKRLGMHSIAASLPRVSIASAARTLSLTHRAVTTKASCPGRTWRIGRPASKRRCRTTIETLPFSNAAPGVRGLSFCSN